MGKDCNNCCKKKRCRDDDHDDHNDGCRTRCKKICVPLRPCPTPIDQVFMDPQLRADFAGTAPATTRNQFAFLTDLVRLATQSNDVCRQSLVTNALAGLPNVQTLLTQIFAFPATTLFTDLALRAKITELYTFIGMFLCNPSCWPCNWKQCKCQSCNSCNPCCVTQTTFCNPCDPCSGAYGCGF